MAFSGAFAPGASLSPSIWIASPRHALGIQRVSPHGRVIASLWRAGAGPVVPARAKRTPSPARDVGEDPKGVPDAPLALMGRPLAGPWMGGGGSRLPEGSSPFPPQVSAVICRSLSLKARMPRHAVHREMEAPG